MMGAVSGVFSNLTRVTCQTLADNAMERQLDKVHEIIAAANRPLEAVECILNNEIQGITKGLEETNRYHDKQFKQ